MRINCIFYGEKGYRKKYLVFGITAGSNFGLVKVYSEMFYAHVLPWPFLRVYTYKERNKLRVSETNERKQRDSVTKLIIRLSVFGMKLFELTRTNGAFKGFGLKRDYSIHLLIIFKISLSNVWTFIIQSRFSDLTRVFSEYINLWFCSIINIEN